MGVASELKGLRRGGKDPRDILAAAFEVENEQTFHLKELYKYIHDFLWKDESFVSYWGDDKPEILYFEKQNATGVREHHIWWRLYKYPDNNRYIRYFLKIDFQTLAMGKKEIIKNGQKFKMDSGDIIIRIQAYLQLDYKEEWKDNWLLKNFDELFRRKIYKQKIQYHKDELYKKAYEIQNKIKQFLQLAMPGKMETPYQPPKGLRD